MKTDAYSSSRADESPLSFQVPVRNEAGFCAQPGCSCGKSVIPKGTGYLHISEKVVDFRKDCPSPKDLLYKLNKMLADLGCFGTVELDHGVLYPQLLCKEAAIGRQLSLEVAAKDAENWWNTGEVPLRSNEGGSDPNFP